MQTALHGKIKEERGEWLIGVNTQHVPYVSIVAKLHKTRKRRVSRLLMKSKAHRRVGV